MTIAIKTQHHSLPEESTVSGRATFGNTVKTAGACLQGYLMNFSGGDHHIQQMGVQIQNVMFSGNEVTYDIVFKMHDSSKNKGVAEVDVMVVAEIASA